jgi:hypothetical protein
MNVNVLYTLFIIASSGTMISSCSGPAPNAVDLQSDPDEDISSAELLRPLFDEPFDSLDEKSASTFLYGTVSDDWAELEFSSTGSTPDLSTCISSSLTKIQQLDLKWYQSEEIPNEQKSGEYWIGRETGNRPFVHIFSSNNCGFLHSLRLPSIEIRFPNDPKIEDINLAPHETDYELLRVWINLKKNLMVTVSPQSIRYVAKNELNPQKISDDCEATQNQPRETTTSLENLCVNNTKINWVAGHAIVKQIYTKHFTPKNIPADWKEPKYSFDRTGSYTVVRLKLDDPQFGLPNEALLSEF